MKLNCGEIERMDVRTVVYLEKVGIGLRTV